MADAAAAIDAMAPAVEPTPWREFWSSYSQSRGALLGLAVVIERKPVVNERAARRPASGRTDRQSRRFWRRQNTEAFRLGIAAGKQHSKCKRLDPDDTGRRRRLQRLDHADRHQRAIGAIHGFRLVRAARHVSGHGSRSTGHGGHRHGCRRVRGRARRKRGIYEACDQKDRQQPAKVDRALHERSFAQSGP